MLKECICWPQGTLLRTATALGWQGAFLLPGCCDAFNDKALRAGRSAAFQLPYATGCWDDLLRIVEAHQMTCLAAQLPEEGELCKAEGPKSVASLFGTNTAACATRFAMHQRIASAIWSCILSLQVYHVRQISRKLLLRPSARLCAWYLAQRGRGCRTQHSMCAARSVCQWMETWSR